jgi:hypothetical protein
MIELSSNNINHLVVEPPDNPLQELNECFSKMKLQYEEARNELCGNYMDEYGDEEGVNIFAERYPEPINIDTLANQARIITNKYKLCGTTNYNEKYGFIIKIENVRLRVRTYCNMGDYYCWIRKSGIAGFSLNIYQAMPNRKGQLVYGGATYPHPHISGTAPCLGGFESVIKTASGHFNMVGIVNQVKMYLNSYYGRSTYVRISEFRPFNIFTVPLEIMKNMTTKYVDSFYLKQLSDSAKEKEPKADKLWIDSHKKVTTIEVKPQDGLFYKRTEDRLRQGDANSLYLNSKVVMMSQVYVKEYYQCWSMLTYHAAKMSNNENLKLPKDYRNKYLEMKMDLLEDCNCWYTMGFGNGDRIRPDDVEERDVIIRLFKIIQEKVNPTSSNTLRLFEDMTLSAFYIYLKQYEKFESLENPISNVENRIENVCNLIDHLWPKFIIHTDALKKKVIVKLDKEKRRLINGLNNTQSNSESNQLSFETIS